MAFISEKAFIAETAVISDSAVIEDGVTIAERVIVKANVTVCKNSFIGAGVVLGEETRDFYKDPASYAGKPVEIGPNSIIRSGSIIYAGCIIGADLETGHYVTIREETVIGNNFRIGNFSDIQGFATIGDNTRCHSNVHIAQFSKIGNHVWLMPYSLLTNDLHPPCGACMEGATISDYAVIGAKALLLPKIKIGNSAFVAAGAVVTKSVEDGVLVSGDPARFVCYVEDIPCSSGKREKPYKWQEKIGGK